jgi:hypothetical protein
MATLRQYFDTDFSRVLSINQNWECQSAASSCSVIARLHLDFDANAKFASFYVPSYDDPGGACEAFIRQVDNVLRFDKDVEVQSGYIGEDDQIESQELRFSGRMFVYTETEITSIDRKSLRLQAIERNLALRIRGPGFAMARAKIEKPLAFISHDSRDKDTVARQIAIGLSKLACPVWFDEFSLKVGDSLRESIEKGLKECKKCILILSPSFFANPGWTKVEFNSIFTREILESQNLVLPVWYEVTKQQVFDYCPSLLDRLGVNWSLGGDEVIKRLYRAIT